MSTHIHDLIGIGFGPANIAVATALDELHGGLDCIYFEHNEVPVRQEHMLLTGSDIQHHSLRDLAPLRNPRSRFTFTNFLDESEHLNLPTPFPLRTE